MLDSDDDDDESMHGTSHPEPPREVNSSAERVFPLAVNGNVAAASKGRRQDMSSGNSRPRRWLRGLRSAILALQLGRTTSQVLLRFSAWTLALAICGGVAVAGGMVWSLQHWPDGNPPHDSREPALLLEAQDGEPLGRLGALKLFEADEFPKRLIAAVLSIEDHRFYDHLGVDPIGIGRALFRNIEVGGIVEGGSTITQQLIKIRYLNNERRYARKLREALMAIMYELRYSKDRILAEYLNSVYMGEGAYGMPAAARLYFDKRLSELTVAEAAMLAGVIRSPSLYNPARDLEAAQARAAVVVQLMHDYDLIDEDIARQAIANPATLNQPDVTARARSWFADWVSREARNLTGPYRQSMRVRTTLAPKLQRLAQQVVNDVLKKHGSRLNVSQAALVAMRPNGAVVAMVGGRAYDKSQFNRAAAANRHPGSTFKLFVYLAALRKGYTLDDMIDAGPVSIGGWEPENYGEQVFGKVTLADAFAQSINTAAARLAMQVGLGEVIASARDLGIDAPLERYPSLALGATGISLVDMTGAFASLRTGRRVQPWGIAALGSATHSELRSVGGTFGGGGAIGSERDAMIALLRRVVESGTGRRAALPGFAAGKTGTSQDYRDAWFMGFNETLVTGVWVGNDDYSPMKRVAGGTLPAMIWQRFMVEATRLMLPDSPAVAATRIRSALPVAAQLGVELPDGVRAQASEEELTGGDGESLEAPSSRGETAAATARAEATPARRTSRNSEIAPGPRVNRQHGVSPASY